jgi:hypothetical protein
MPSGDWGVLTSSTQARSHARPRSDTLPPPSKRAHLDELCNLMMIEKANTLRFSHGEAGFHPSV